MNHFENEEVYRPVCVFVWVCEKETYTHLCGSTEAWGDIGVDTTQVAAPGQGSSRHLPQTWVPGRPAPPGGTGRRAGQAARG